MSINLPTGGAFLPLAGGTLTGPLTFADAAAWSSTGLADAASYTTSNTAMFSLSPTWNFSDTGNNIAPILLSPTLVPTGATAGTGIGGLRALIGVGTSAVNIGSLHGINLQLNPAAGYSGTITTGTAIQASINNSGSNPIGTTTVFNGSGTSNGNGNTSGNIVNKGFSSGIITAAAGVGGTISNMAYEVNLPSASSASTTNAGIRISGNGGAASTNWAIISTSTAPSQLGGSFATAAPAGSTSGAWKLGALQAGAVVVDPTRSIFVDIDGTVYKMIVAA